MRHSIAYATRAETPEDVAALFPPEIAFHQLPAPDGNLWGYARLLPAITQVVRKTQPNVVHCHSSKAGILGRAAAFWLGVPSVYTPHGYAFLRTDISPITKAFFTLAEWGGARLGSATAACGHEEFILSQKLGPPKDRVIYIPNAIDFAFLDTFLPDLPANDKSCAVVRAGICGRLVSQRDPALFAAIALATEDVCQWTWIGASKTATPAQSAAGLNLPPNVERTGWLNRAGALSRMAGLDIYIQTSRWEGLSYAVLEAMSLGKPVVATDIPANRAVIEHGVTGLLGNDGKQMAAHVRRLAGDADLRKNMGEAARKYVREHHDATRAYEKLSRLYQDLHRSL